MHLLGLERQMHLPGAAKFAKALEDPAGDLLDAAVRIEAETDLSMPDIADRHGNPEFASTGLGPGGVQHPRTQNAEFKLTDAALHAEKQTIIWATRIVDAIKVDDAGIDEAAEFEQMMPVPAVAGETGGIEAKHGADLASAEPGNEFLEARARHGSAGRTAQVVVDDLDAAKSVPAGFINKVILAALALEIDLHLRLCGLTHIHDRLAAQHCGREGISVRHRRSPRDPSRWPPSEGGRDGESRCCGRRASSRSKRDGPAISRADGAACRKQSDVTVIA